MAPMTWFVRTLKGRSAGELFRAVRHRAAGIVKAHPGNHVPEDELLAWTRDRAGCMVDARLSGTYRWKLGDRMVIRGTIFPADLELTLGAIYTSLGRIVLRPALSSRVVSWG